MNVVGTQIPSSISAVDLANTHDGIYASVGIHPIQHDVVDVEEEADSFQTRGEQWDDELFYTLAREPKVIGIGETGLDRFHIRTDLSIEEIFNKQKDLFLKHYDLARSVDKPLIIHVREAHDEMIDLLVALERKQKDEGTTGGKLRGTIHCFTGTWSHAQKYIELGLHLGFTGVITFPTKASDPNTMNVLEETIFNMPLDRVLVETDSPYLTAQILRGTRNEPWLVEECVKKIAAIRGLTYDEVAEVTTYNAKRLFGLAI